MESLKRLEEVAKECIKDIKAIESKVSITEGNLSFLESKKSALTAEISDLETKKLSVLDSIGNAERDAKIKIDDAMREIKLKEEMLTADRANLKTRIYQAEAERAEAEANRAKYATLYSEYLIKSQELEEKRQAIMGVLK